MSSGISSNDTSFTATNSKAGIGEDLAGEEEETAPATPASPLQRAGGCVSPAESTDTTLAAAAAAAALLGGLSVADGLTRREPS